jgi:hypothetical protein
MSKEGEATARPKPMIKETPPSFPALITLMLLLAASGCSNPREDVRVTLCKDMVASQTGTKAEGIDWTSSETETRGHQYAAVRLRFSAAGNKGRAACYYDYDAVEDTAIILANPLAAYSTSPSRMTLNGKTLSRAALARAVKDAMLGQGKDFIERVREKVR